MVNAIVKTCGCGKMFTKEQWKGLHYVGAQHIAEDQYGPEENLELRDCPCGSTLAIDLLAQ